MRIARRSMWTVNSKTELEQMKLLGVDNIITDDPGAGKSFSGRKPRKP